MNEFEKMIKSILVDKCQWISHVRVQYIKDFISKCSISDFEKLKEMDYDLSTAKNESDDTAE